MESETHILKETMTNFVHRPTAESRKIHSKNEFELCYLRHQYLRRVNYNPTEEEMTPYMKIVERMSRNTFYTYRYLFSTVGMELTCIINIGRVYLVEFLGLFELSESKNQEKYAKFWLTFCKNNNKQPDEFDLRNKNKADFTLFMKQRMEDLVRICKQKAKNIRGLRIDDYIPFCGPYPPPEELYKLLEDNEAYHMKRIDHVRFKAVKKKAKADIRYPFQWSDSWYVAVTLEHRTLSIVDLEGADLDPYNLEHNLNPEQALMKKQAETHLDKTKKMFNNYPEDKKAKVLLSFIEENEDNPHYEEEIVTAKKFLKKIGVEYVSK